MRHAAPQVESAACGQGETEVTTRWKYFRMDPVAFMMMGILKVARARRIDAWATPGPTEAAHNPTPTRLASL